MRSGDTTAPMPPFLWHSALVADTAGGGMQRSDNLHSFGTLMGFDFW